MLMKSKYNGTNSHKRALRTLKVVRWTGSWTVRITNFKDSSLVYVKTGGSGQVGFMIQCMLTLKKQYYYSNNRNI